MTTEKEKTCECCKNEPATILCPECCKCYCDKCSEIAHSIATKKEHKTEAIPKGVTVKATCPLHEKIPLELFCVDEKKLCCPMCVFDKLHRGHDVVKIAEVAQDNEIFSAAEVKKDFEGILNRDITLDKKIDETIESINKNAKEMAEKIKKAFEEERRKLEDEEVGLLKELEQKRDEATNALEEIKSALGNAREYSNLLSDAGKMSDEKCGRLMELNIVSEMDEQRKKVKKLLGTEMLDLQMTWDGGARKLSFTRNLFNGGVSVSDVSAKAVSWDEIEVSWKISGDKEENDDDEIKYVVEMRKEGEKDWNEVKSGLKDKKCSVNGLVDDSAYEFRVKAVKGSGVGEWSDSVRRKIPKKSFENSWWKECPDDVDKMRKYVVDEKNPRIATKIMDSPNSGISCTIIGNTPIPLNAVTSWSVKVLKSRNNNCASIWVGVAPSDINQNGNNTYKCGWHFSCYYSRLWSGPPHGYGGKEYCPRKADGQNVHNGDSVGVVMDTTKGDLSFILNRANLGVAYEGIPLDKPLVPCSILYYFKDDSVELIMRS